MVLPFTVNAAGDSLGAETADRLDRLLHGDRGERTWRFRDVQTAFEERGMSRALEDGLQIAASLGARRLVRGTIVTTGDRVTMSAYIERVPTGTRLADVRVEGPQAQSTDILRRLAVLVLNHGWDDALSEQELASASGPALEAYLEAVRARWRGDLAVALRAAREARDGRGDLAGPVFIEWLSDPTPESFSRAWEVRTRLSDRARTQLEAANAGRAPGGWPTARERIDHLEQAYGEHGRWHETIDRLVDEQVVWGAYAGRRDLGGRLRNLEIQDTALVEGEEGLADLWRLIARDRRTDPEDLRSIGFRLLDQLDGAEADDERFLAYDVATALGDSSRVRRMRAEGIHALDPAMFLALGMLEGRPRNAPLDDLSRAIGQASEDYITTRQGRWADHFAFRLAEARGWPDSAMAVAAALSRLPAADVHPDGEGDPWWYVTRPIEHALYETGWEPHVEWALRELEERPYVASQHPWYGEVERECWPALAKIVLGRLEEAEAHVVPLRSATEADSTVQGVCLAAVEALIEHHGRGSDSGAGNAPAADSLPPSGASARLAPERDPSAKLDAFDRLMRTAPRETLTGVANLALAGIYAERGRNAEALEAVARRPWNRLVYSSIPGYLSLEGRLALAEGDSARARLLLERYRQLRTAPEPGLEDEVEIVAEALAELRTESGG